MNTLTQKDKSRAYYLKNRDAILLKKRECHILKREAHAAKCLAYYAKNKDKQRAKLIKKRFGISECQYREMERVQNFVCAICKEPEKTTRNGIPQRLAIDHCHETNHIRGLLCVNCNTALGKFNDNRFLLESAISYLDSSANRQQAIISLMPSK